MRSGNFNLLSDSSNIHTDKLIQSVSHRINQRNDLTVSDVAATSKRLATLWRANIAELAYSPRIPSSNIAIDKHYRLLEPVLKDPTVFGCTGEPVWYLPRPLYACEMLSMKPKNTDKRHDNKVNVLDRVNKQRNYRKRPRISAEEGDLLIGVRVHANLPALLRLQHLPLPDPYCDDENLSKWVEGRVVSITTVSTLKRETGGSYKRLQIRVRCGRNGAEIESHWPGNINITTQPPPVEDDLQARVHLTASSQRAAGLGLPTSSAGLESAAASRSHTAAAASSNGTSSSAQGLLALNTPDLPRRERSLTAGTGDNRAETAEKSAEEALRILMGGAPLDSHRSGFLSDSSSDDEGGGELGGLWQSLFGESSVDRVPQAFTAANSAGELVGSAGVPAEDGASKERLLLLATGERLLREQLEEIEESFERQQLVRPRFVLNPQRGQQQQRVNEETEEARRRKNRARSSRNWAGDEPLPDRDAAEQEELQSAAALQGVALSALEDPTVPLPEPAVVLIGRAVKKLRRREDCWVTELIDVYMRVLPEGQSAADSSSSSYRDMVVPRCVLRLEADGPFPVSPASPAVEGGRGQRGDGQWAQNLALLHALLV